MKILFVCTGNLCRSPMAHAMTEHELRTRGCNGIEVASVGTWALDGRRATPEAVETVRKRGVDLAAHRSRPLHLDELKASDVIVVMTSVHVREIASLAPEVVDRIVLMKELPEIVVGPLDAGASREDRLRELLKGERPPQRRALDLDDPMGLPMSAYERCAGELEKGINALLDVLCV